MTVISEVRVDGLTADISAGLEGGSNGVDLFKPGAHVKLSVEIGEGIVGLASGGELKSLFELVKGEVHVWLRFD